MGVTFIFEVVVVGDPLSPQSFYESPQKRQKTLNRAIHSVTLGKYLFSYYQ